MSDDDTKLGRPENFEVTVRDFEIAAGAGFIIPMLGDAMRMPGLPSVPSAQGMTIDDDGVITQEQKLMIIDWILNGTYGNNPSLEPTQELNDGSE